MRDLGKDESLEAWATQVNPNARNARFARSSFRDGCQLNVSHSM